MKNFAPQKGQSQNDNGFDGKILGSSPVFSDRYYLIPDSFVLPQAETQSFLNNSSPIVAKLKPNLGKTQTIFPKLNFANLAEKGQIQTHAQKKSLL